MHANYFCFQTNYGYPSVSKHLGEKTLLPCCCFYLIDVIVNLQWSTYNFPVKYQCKATQTGDENIREIYQLTKSPSSIALSERVLNNISKKMLKNKWILGIDNLSLLLSFTNSRHAFKSAILFSKENCLLL